MDCIVHGVAKSWTRLSDFHLVLYILPISTLLVHSQCEASILAWEIPCTEEPGRLQSMGSQESDTTEATKQQQFYHSSYFLAITVI